MKAVLLDDAWVYAHFDLLVGVLQLHLRHDAIRLLTLGGDLPIIDEWVKLQDGTSRLELVVPLRLSADASLDGVQIYYACTKKEHVELCSPDSNQLAHALTDGSESDKVKRQHDT